MARKRAEAPDDDDDGGGGNKEYYYYYYHHHRIFQFQTVLESQHTYGQNNTF